MAVLANNNVEIVDEEECKKIREGNIFQPNASSVSTGGAPTHKSVILMIERNFLSLKMDL